jgi:hypothetical protein
VLATRDAPGPLPLRGPCTTAPYTTSDDRAVRHEDAASAACRRSGPAEESQTAAQIERDFEPAARRSRLERLAAMGVRFVQLALPPHCPFVRWKLVKHFTYAYLQATRTTFGKARHS